MVAVDEAPQPAPALPAPALPAPVAAAKPEPEPSQAGPSHAAVQVVPPHDLNAPESAPLPREEPAAAGPAAAAKSGAVDWKVLDLPKPGAAARQVKPEPASAPKPAKRPTVKARAADDLLDIAASSLAAGIMAASRRQYGTQEALGVLDEVRAALQPQRAAKKRG